MRWVEQWWRMLPGGSGDLVILFLQLVVAVSLIGWSYNRGFRANERGSVLRLSLLTIAFGLALLLRDLHDQWWQSAMIVVAVIVAGFMGRNDNGRGLALPVVLVAALLGHGLVLSAIALTLVAIVLYLLSPVPKR